MQTKRDKLWRIDQNRFIIRKKLTSIMQTSYKKSNNTFDINGIPRGNYLWFYQMGNRDYREVKSGIYKQAWKYRYGKKRFKKWEYTSEARFAIPYTKKTDHKLTLEILKDAGII